MKEIKEGCVKGTRILLGNEKRTMINEMIKKLSLEGFMEISIPVIQSQMMFKGKIGGENTKMMYTFMDEGLRELALAPEYTAVVMKLSGTHFKFEKDVKLFYVQECFRGQKPQAGRYRQFTQLGVEILNPTQDYGAYLQELALKLVGYVGSKGFTLNTDVKRGLDYYKDGKGFEITCDKLGAQKQIVGGGSYPGGIGFALGIDRLMLLT